MALTIIQSMVQSTIVQSTVGKDDRSKHDRSKHGGKVRSFKRGRSGVPPSVSLVPRRLAMQVCPEADRHPAASGAQADRVGCSSRLEEPRLDAIAKMVVDFVQRSDRHVHELRELGRVVSPESLGDVPRRGPDCITELIAKLEIGPRLRSGKKCQHLSSQFCRSLKNHEFAIGPGAHAGRDRHMACRDRRTFALLIVRASARPCFEPVCFEPIVL
jgi:hypothetical protein